MQYSHECLGRWLLFHGALDPNCIQNSLGFAIFIVYSKHSAKVLFTAFLTASSDICCTSASMWTIMTQPVVYAKKREYFHPHGETLVVVVMPTLTGEKKRGIKRCTTVHTFKYILHYPCSNVSKAAIVFKCTWIPSFIKTSRSICVWNGLGGRISHLLLVRAWTLAC